MMSPTGSVQTTMDTLASDMLVRRILMAVGMYKGSSSAYKFQIEDRLNTDFDISPELFQEICEHGYLRREGDKFHLTSKGKELADMNSTCNL